MRLANGFETMSKLDRVAKVAGKGITALNFAATIGDAVTNGWKRHHIADIAINTILAASGPVGWGFGLLYLGVDLISQSLTEKSLTENLFD